MNAMPTLSVIVTNYNYGHFLEQAVDSLYQNQSLDCFEVLLIDDGSTDNSKEVVQRLLRRFSSLRFFQHEQNRGQEAAFETVYPHLRGEYLHPFAADDVMLPGSIDLMLHYFKLFPNISTFCSDNSHFSVSNPSPRLEVSKILDCQTFHYFTPHAVYKLFSHTDFWIPGHTIFAKKDIYLKYTPFDKNLCFINDWWVNHRLVLKEGVGYIPQPISAQRKHSFSLSAAPSLQHKRAVWLYLLNLIEGQREEHKLLYKSGIFRMFGLKAIYKDLLATPKYWKYLGPICRKMIEKKLMKMLALNSDHYWLKRILERTLSR
jgi:glycosyltransferase involved in cell wall biosynthesis